MDHNGSHAAPVLRPLLTDDSVNGDFAIPAGTVTLLLADVEGSTRLWEERSSEMPDMLAALDREVDEAVGRAGGVRPIEQGEGDSFVAAFSRASDAVRCALDLQRRLVHEPLKLRIGIHTGEVQLREQGRYIGAAVNRTARLRDIGHGGQTLLSQPTAELVANHLPDPSSLRDLGSFRLRDLRRPERVHQLCHPDLQADFSPLRSLDALPHNLPVQLTSFVGRRTDMDEVTKLLAGERLVTLTGSGGCGKTRLALQVAAERLEVYPDGAWLVDLSPVTDPALVAKHVADGLSLPEMTRDVAGLAEGIGSRTMLVVLDNCEHVVRESALLCEQLLRSCDGLSVLATSREPLGVAGEVTWRVPSLSYPDAQDAPPVEAVSQYEAVELFVDRARRARPRFVLDEDSSPAVAEICHRLDGIPLAIELAAARVRVLSVRKISDGLHDRFRLLTGGARTAVPRQQTLEASVEWSHDLLLDAERVLLRRLSVFAGGFTLEATEHVCAADAIESHHILDLLSQLVDKSLVVVGDDERFRLLETVRQYGASRLRDAGEADEVRQRHFRFFFDYVPTRRGDGSEDGYRARIEADYENVRRALQTAAEDDDPEALLRFTGRLFGFWMMSMHKPEARGWLERALAAGQEASPRNRARALRALAHIAAWAGDWTSQLAAAEESLEVCRQLGDKRGSLWSLMTLCNITASNGLPQTAGHLEEAIALAEELGDRRALMFAVQMRGWSGKPEARRRDLERAIELARATGARRAELGGMSFFADFVYSVGDLVEAKERYEAILSDLRANREPFLLSRGLHMFGMILCDLGAFDQARGVCTELETFAEAVGDDNARSNALGAAVALKTHEGDWLAVRRLCAEGLRINAPGSLMYPVGVARLAHAERRMGERDAARRRLDELLSAGPPRPAYCAWALSARAIIALEDGELERAEDLAREALALGVGEARGTWWLREPLLVLAAVTAAAGEAEQATRLIAAEDAFRRAAGAVPSPIANGLVGPAVLACRAALGDERFQEVWTQGDAMSFDNAVAYATRGRGPRKRPSSGWESLTPAERDVVKLVAEGLSNADVAERLFVARRTVTTHLGHVFAKLGVSSRAELMAAFVRRREVG